MPFDNRLGNPPNLITKGHVVRVCRRKPRMQAEIEQAYQKSHQKNRQRRGENFPWPGGLGFDVRNVYSFAGLLIQRSLWFLVGEN